MAEYPGTVPVDDLYQIGYSFLWLVNSNGCLRISTDRTVAASQFVSGYRVLSLPIASS